MPSTFDVTLPTMQLLLTPTWSFLPLPIPFQAGKSGGEFLPVSRALFEGCFAPPSCFLTEIHLAFPDSQARLPPVAAIGQIGQRSIKPVSISLPLRRRPSPPPARHPQSQPKQLVRRPRRIVLMYKVDVFGKAASTCPLHDVFISYPSDRVLASTLLVNYLVKE